jgi:hypothetical protein
MVISIEVARRIYIALAAKIFAPFPPSATLVIPTGADRRNRRTPAYLLKTLAASLLRSSRPAKWRDLSSLFIGVKIL